MINWFKETRFYKWLMEHKWARRGLLAFLTFQALKSIAWTVLFISIWLGYTNSYQ